jgi:CBS domain containing-hemolysin-like protein
MSAYFSATETAFSSINKIRLKNLAEKGNKKAELVLKLSDNYDVLISTILIGNNIVNILASSLCTLLFFNIFKGGSLEGISSLISTVILTLVILTFGEISPKTVAKKKPEAFSMFSAPVIKVFIIILYPLSFLFRHLQKLLAKIFKSDEEKGITEEELISIIEEAEEDGEIDEEESTLIKSAIEFNDLEVSDIFTPRVDITAVSSDSTAEEISEVFSESGYSRLPVYKGDLDNIIGILYYKDFYNTDFKTIDEITKPVVYVAKTKRINDLLKELQNQQMHFAVVIDEFGATAGIVTLEDILEEIVGEIWDEHDEKVLEIEKVGENEYTVAGMTNLDKLFDELEIDTEAEAQTVNGWVMTILEKIPAVGDEFEAEGLSVKVLAMDGKRIESVQVIDNRSHAEDGEAPEEEKSEE